MSESPHVVILAGGASTRLGQPKQLVRLDGRPLLHTMVSRAVALSGHAVTVVLGANAQDLTQLLRHTPASVIVNRQWREGLGSSIRLGVSALPPACDAVLLMLADQFAVTADDLRRLASAWKGQDTVIAASLYSGTVGVPAIFPRWCFPDLMGLRGDSGAKTVLHRHADRLVRVQMPNAAMDLDTPEQLAELRRMMQERSAEIRVPNQPGPELNLNS
ncbi:MAG TPA: nucleotidyltransferase family protein [Steroidobacteraceae bacterium]|nr:nucleotidyltransferase family protein [Steroidobacteraceae bacterium]